MTKDAVATAHSKTPAVDPGAITAPGTAIYAPSTDVQAESPRAARPRARADNPQRAPDAAETRGNAGSRSETSKTEIVLKKLRLARGATVVQIMEATGWQAHSVRGFLSASARRKLAQAAGGKSTTQPASAGTKLVREWQGTVHVVTIDENGIIRWNDREWTSLSAVARFITGGHWSGPAFFGLRRALHGMGKPEKDRAGTMPTSTSVQTSRQGRVPA